ncbi:trypsin-like peptidase domain-containing protein [Acidocella aminolytica]|uniref:trypsin-like peptidase domain-containing protein n=2 Tax=Acidocella aminolytica TaxID=33998 RepID=UPI00091696DB|nr:trypsin-like peptidase domain-containing protein [Acidocella aminolytica]SHE36322.1 2-alkenal reductase [Acidocella aminolytica 101 = DSM 11237]
MPLLRRSSWLVTVGFMKLLARSFSVLFLLAAAVAHAADLPPALADLAAKVAPAVVSIASMAPVNKNSAQDDGSDDGSGDGSAYHPASDKPSDTASTVVPPPKTIESLGSGFVFDPAGYILTNNHVVNGASNITVTFPDGTVYPAIIAGRDRDADLAVLKINAGHKLPFVPFGDSNKMRVGDWVLAVGNPFGMPGTNTAGIVSALHRQIDDTKYDDFIQTDAAINKGNSGGPLFNLQGQVIGVNSAIYAPSGASDGIGFSIPSAMAEPVAEALAHSGKMVRGWLGVATEEVTPSIQGVLKLQSPKGALVGAVSARSPASGKLQPGDVITAMGGTPIDNPRALFIRTAEFQTGQSVKVDFVRNGVAAHTQLTITASPPARDENIEQTHEPKPKPVTLSAYGLGLAGNPAENGVSVTSATGPAAKAGIVAGNIIQQVNGVVVATATDVRKQVDALGDAPAVFLISGPAQGGGNPGPRWVAVKPNK